jgi:DNA-binding transcriptional regulator YdaS (Cro superfamily)
MNLRAYLNSIPIAEQREFAARCGTTLGYMRKAITKRQRFDARLCVSVDRESKGLVPVEETRPDVDWAYLRGTSRRP